MPQNMEKLNINICVGKIWQQSTRYYTKNLCLCCPKNTKFNNMIVKGRYYIFVSNHSYNLSQKDLIIQL